MFQDFKKFILRGNLVDLAVAVVIGTAFGDVVKSLVSSVITPMIAAVGSQPDFAKMAFQINGSTFSYGVFLNALVSFLLIATVVFFVVVQPVNKLLSASNRRKTTDDPTTKKCPDCLSEVPIKATRCAFCTSKIS